VRRREFIALLGGAAAAAFVGASRAWAQQSGVPVIGVIDTRSSDVIADRLRGFRQGLKETGFIEGENVAILYRLAENQSDLLPGLAADLVRRNVVVIVTAGDDVALVAAKATTKIPIVFIASQDPVKLGLVTSLTRPGGNATGINFLTGELVAKRLELLRELVPKAARMAVLVNPSNPTSTEATTRDVEVAARSMHLDVQVFNASSRQEIDGCFASFAVNPPDALFVGTDTFFSGRRVQLVNLATRHAIPTAFPNREAAEIGALMSYGTSVIDAWRQSGIYVGRILQGAKPAEMPVVQARKFELIINAQTARMLNVVVPDRLIALADEVIE
jgi:putative ABC transport system substrate-binding protein